MANQSPKGARLAVAAIITTVLIGGAAATGSYLWASNTAFAAKVNGEVVSSQEYQSIVERAKKQFAGQMGNDFNSKYGHTMLVQMKKNIMDSLVDMTLMKQEAKNMGLSVSDDEKQAQFKEFLKSRYQGNEEALEEDLKQNRITREEFDKQFNDQLLLQKLYQKVITDVKVSEADSKKFYEENKDKFGSPEEISAQHILIKADEKDEAAVKKAKAKAMDLIKQLQAGASFAELAKKNSEDKGSGANGGDLGKFGKGRMVKPFEEAAWALKPGEITTEPVQSRFGWHIIKRGETYPAETKPFEEVKSSIEAQLLSKKKKEHFETWMKGIKDKATIKINEELLKVPEVSKPDKASPSAEDPAATQNSSKHKPANKPADKPADQTDTANHD